MVWGNLISQACIYENMSLEHRAYIEGVSRRNAFWRLDSEFRVVLQIQSLWPKIGKIWTLDLESSINFDSKSRVVHPF